MPSKDTTTNDTDRTIDYGNVIEKGTGIFDNVNQPVRDTLPPPQSPPSSDQQESSNDNR